MVPAALWLKLKVGTQPPTSTRQQPIDRLDAVAGMQVNRL
jgi:hypothetical protein